METDSDSQRQLQFNNTLSHTPSTWFAIEIKSLPDAFLETLSDVNIANLEFVDLSGPGVNYEVGSSCSLANNPHHTSESDEAGNPTFAIIVHGRWLDKLWVANELDPGCNQRDRETVSHAVNHLSLDVLDELASARIRAARVKRGIRGARVEARNKTKTQPSMTSPITRSLRMTPSTNSPWQGSRDPGESFGLLVPEKPTKSATGKGKRRVIGLKSSRILRNRVFTRLEGI